MLLHDANLPEAVLVVLLPERAVGRSVAIRAPDRWIADDPSTVVEQPVAELVVLVADHVLIEPQSSIGLPAADAHIDGIDLLLDIGVMEPSVPDTERRTRRDRNRLPECALT